MTDNMLDSSPESTSQTDLSSNTSQDGGGLPSVTDLGSLERFKFAGREWTPKELEQAYLRQQDYTKKTQELSEARKSFEGERKFYENLHADLEFVRRNPDRAQDFIRTYPQKFHQALRNALGESSGATQQTQGAQSSPQKPDIELMSRLSKLEDFYTQQEVSKNEAEINRTIDTLTKKYPEAVVEMAIGRVYEAYSQVLKENPGAKLTHEMWENSFKQVDQFMKERWTAKTKESQKQQLQANKKSGDVSAGGGTVGRAPQKFKSLKDVTEYAVKDLTGRT